MTSESSPALPKQSHILRTILTPAVRLWLRSQVERAEDLQLQISGGDRQILSGYLPQVTLSAQQIIYRGLYLSEMQVEATEIRVNLGQVLRGKPLQLLQPIPIQAHLALQEADLNASLRSELLSGAIAEFLVKLLNLKAQDDVSPALSSVSLQDSQMWIKPETLTLKAILLAEGQPPLPLLMQTGLHIEGGRMLRLVRPCLLPTLEATQGEPLDGLDGFTIDLGPEVDLQELTLTPGQLLCRGRIQVNP